MLSIALVSRDRMAKLNRRFLRKRGDTDVIAFGFAPTGAGIVGDIYIAPDVAARNAKREMVSVGSEIDRLIVHGVLHVLGYDHPDTDARVKSKMWKRQEQILSLIAR